MTELTPETLDLAEILAGQTYPEEVVIMPLDRKAAKDLFDTRDELRVKKAIRNIDKKIVTELEAKVLDLEEKSRGNALKITVQGLSRDALKALNLSLEELDGEIQQGDDETKVEYGLRKGEALQKRYWGAYISKIEHAGVKVLADQGMVDTLVTGIADPVASLIEKAIQAVDDEAQRGFESAVFDADF